MYRDSSCTKCQHFTLSIARPHLFLTAFSQFQSSARHCNDPSKIYRASFGMPFSNFYTHAQKESHDNKFLNWCRLFEFCTAVWVPFCELWTSIVLIIMVIAQSFLARPYHVGTVSTAGLVTDEMVVCAKTVRVLLKNVWTVWVPICEVGTTEHCLYSNGNATEFCSSSTKKNQQQQQQKNNISR